MALTSVNPATGLAGASYDEHSADDVERRLALASRVFPAWRDTTVHERSTILQRVGAILEAEQDRFGRMMTEEMGKTLRSAREEAAKCALACRYYAEHAADFLAPEPIGGGEPGSGAVRYQPLGAILAVMPWNFPFWQVIRFAAPALAAGNVGLLKHASNVPGCAVALEDLFRRAGAPDGVFQTLLVGSARVDSIIGDGRVAAVTLTGSESAGRSVATAAGRHLKKTVLELGGSDPFIVAPSANLARAADVAISARIVNNGQSCIAAKRFIVVDAVADEFEARFTGGMRRLRVGDPREDSTDLGPLATAAIRDELHAQVNETARRGARVALGGHPLDGPGFYYAPTVLTDVPRGAPAAEQELFGPVASLFRVPSVDDAIALANDTPFGLAASAWTGDSAEAEKFANGIEAGLVFINGMVASDPRFPFGGVKQSGYGRELGAWGLREFVNVKSVRRW
ncbi:MAG TPA: NAD-dependent succinate-semialdehyde dehydrogenase [Gemmatimonadaceae bacterium]